jgi:hypothetical protein
VLESGAVSLQMVTGDDYLVASSDEMAGSDDWWRLGGGGVHRAL